MTILSTLLLALSCSLDNLAVGILYGARRVSVPLMSNLLIAAITSLGTLLFLATGRAVASLLSPETSHVLGAVALVVTGIWILVQGTSGGRREPLEYGAAQRSEEGLHDIRITVASLAVILEDPFIGEVSTCGRLNLNEGWILGLALSLNNVLNGFAAGVAGSHAGIMAGALVLSSLATLWAGLAIGRLCSGKRLKEASSALAGLLIMGIGVYELLC